MGSGNGGRFNAGNLDFTCAQDLRGTRIFKIRRHVARFRTRLGWSFACWHGHVSGVGDFSGNRRCGDWRCARYGRRLRDDTPLRAMIARRGGVEKESGFEFAAGQISSGLLFECLLLFAIQALEFIIETGILGINVAENVPLIPSLSVLAV